MFHKKTLQNYRFIYEDEIIATGGEGGIFKSPTSFPFLSRTTQIR